MPLLTFLTARRDRRRQSTLHSCWAEIHISNHAPVRALCTLTYAKDDPLAVLVRFALDGEVETITVSREHLAAVLLDEHLTAGEHRVTVMRSSNGHKHRLMLRIDEGDGPLFLTLPWAPSRRAVRAMYRWINDEQASALVEQSFADLFSDSLTFDRQPE